MPRSVLHALAIAAALVALTGAASAQEIGRAAAVNPAATANTRIITIGASIAHKERIRTEANGSVQLLFVDKTSMTVGPNSDLVIDEYVFDPNANTGKLAATLGKGALRFVGGQVSHSGDAQIKTANAVIGIRGGLALISQDNIYTGYGSSTVTSGGTSVTLGVGEYTQLSPGGSAPPTPPGLAPPGFLAAQLALFQSKPGQTGGAPTSSAGVQAALTRVTGSPAGTVAGAAPVVNGAAVVSPPTPRVGSNALPNPVLQATQQTVQTSTQTAAIVTGGVKPSGDGGHPGGDGGQPPGQPPTPAAAFALGNTNCCSAANPISNIPFFTLNPNIDLSTSTLTPILGVRPAGSETSSFLQTMLIMSGSRFSQTAGLLVATGSFAPRPNTELVESGAFALMGRYTPTSALESYAGIFSSPAGAVTTDSNRLPQTATVTDRFYNPATDSYSTLGTNPNATATFDQNQTRIATPAGLGAARPDVVLTGVTAGLISTQQTNATNTPFAGTFQTLGASAVALSAQTGRLQADFTVGAVTPVPGGAGFTTGAYQFGSIAPNQPVQTGAYVDDSNFAALPHYTVTGAGPVSVTPVSSVNGQALTSQTGAMMNVSADTAQRALAQTGSNVTFCQCDYTRWGFWSTDSSRTTNGNTYADRGNMLTWVAGRQTTAGEVPTTGIATYDGHVVATIRNGTAEYTSAAGMTNVVNFGARVGNVTVTDLDGASYAGTVNLQGNDPRFFGGTLTTNPAVNASRIMTMGGQFYQGLSSPVGEMGGAVSITGANYIGSGIFAAKMR